MVGPFAERGRNVARFAGSRRLHVGKELFRGKKDGDANTKAVFISWFLRALFSETLTNKQINSSESV